MITVAREPALDATGHEKLDDEATRIATASLDGSTKMVDLQDWGSVFDFGHDRGNCPEWWHHARMDEG